MGKFENSKSAVEPVDVRLRKPVVGINTGANDFKFATRDVKLIQVRARYFFNY